MLLQKSNRAGNKGVLEADEDSKGMCVEMKKAV
jgi:hypothetical protein